MKVVVLAAGTARRMRNLYPDKPKGLYRLAGRELVYRTMATLRNLGYDEFLIVTNPDYESAYREFVNKYGFNAEFVINRHPERGNGYSLYLAGERIKGRFVLIMTDHIYEDAFIREAVKKSGLIVDRVGRYIDKEEATKVRLDKDGNVVEIGKNLERFDAFDTGFFILDDSIFEIAKSLVKDRKTIELSDIVRLARAKTSEVSGYFWADADTPEELKRLRWLLVKRAVKSSGDGFVSRHLNRRISTAITYLVIEHISTFFATWIAFLSGLIAAVVAFYQPALGGILYQISSILDGIDGEIARASLSTSNFGGWLDSLLDRYIDAAFLLALWHHSSGLPAWVLAVSVFGCAMVSYSTERFKAAYSKSAYELLKPLTYIPGKRDERVLFVMIMCLGGWINALYIVLALVCNLRVLLTALLVWHMEEKNKKAR